MVDLKHRVLAGTNERESRQWPIVLVPSTLRGHRIHCSIPGSRGDVAVCGRWSLRAPWHHPGLRQTRAACALWRDRFRRGGSVYFRAWHTCHI